MFSYGLIFDPCKLVFVVKTFFRCLKALVLSTWTCNKAVSRVFDTDSISIFHGTVLQAKENVPLKTFPFLNLPYPVGFAYSFIRRQSSSGIFILIKVVFFSVRPNRRLK